MSPSSGAHDVPRVLISSAGRRVGLVRAFQEVAHQRGGSVMATDMSRFAPALLAADDAALVPRLDDPKFIEALYAIVVDRSINLVVPTLDTELALLAAHHKLFVKAGCHVSVALPAAIAICADKVSTHQWFVANDIPTVRQGSPSTVASQPHDWPWPLIAKPARGSASEGVRLLEGPGELQHCAADDIVQEVAAGVELTIDVYVDRSGVARVAVPRQRLEVRSGEVSKGVTVRHAQAELVAMRIAELLPGAVGAVTVQLFADGSDVRVIEVNPRFGGGYPLAWHAGARFPEWMIQELMGEEPSIGPWVDGLYMLRFDDVIIATEADLP